MTATAQIQNPYWVVPKGPTFQAVKNAPTAGPMSLNLPGPISSSSIRPFVTAANGWFTACGTPVFFQVGNDVLDNGGVLRGMLAKKDNWIAVTGPYADPYKTENFEVPIVPVPGTNNQEFFIFYTNATNFGTEVHVSRYNTLTKTIVSTPTTYLGQGSSQSSAFRFAVSKPLSNGSRFVYGVGRCPSGSPGNVIKILIPGNGVTPAVTEFFTLGTANVNNLIGSELELSHDQTKLAFSAGSTIGIYNLTTNTYSTYSPFPGAFTEVGGVEWLPDGSLASAIDWSTGYDFLDGLCIINPSFTAFGFVSNSGNYKRAALELGYTTTNPPRVFAFNGSSIVGFTGSGSFSGATLTLPYSTLNSGIPFINFNYPVLPDQLDGEYYLNTSNCGGGNTNGALIPDPLENRDTPVQVLSNH